MEVVRLNSTFLIMIMILVTAVMLQEEVPRTRGAVSNKLHILLFGMLCIYRLINFCFIFSL